MPGKLISNNWAQLMRNPSRGFLASIGWASIISKPTPSALTTPGLTSPQDLCMTENIATIGELNKAVAFGGERADDFALKLHRARLTASARDQSLPK